MGSAFVVRRYFLQSNVIGLALMLTWFFLGRAFTIGVYLTLWNQTEHQQLIDQVAAFDDRLKFHFGTILSFRRLNIEFIVYAVAITAYHLKYFTDPGIYSRDNLFNVVFYFCCTIADYFFSMYAIYMVYWARVFLDRSAQVIEALRAVTTTKYICKNSMRVVLELLKLVFDVHASIQNSFGSMLFIIIAMYSFIMAVVIFVTMKKLFECVDCLDLLVIYFSWALPLCLKFGGIIVFFSRIGDVVSYMMRRVNTYIFRLKFTPISFLTGDKNTENCDANVYWRGQANLRMREYTTIHHTRFLPKWIVFQFEYFNFQFDMFNLKLQHMEKSKYITANDFFPINYSMLFNVSPML